MCIKLYYELNIIIDLKTSFCIDFCIKFNFCAMIKYDKITRKKGKIGK